MKKQDVSPYPVEYDLSNCDKEPLHIITTIQAHACLVVCRSKDLSIVQASDNCATKLGVPTSQVLGKTLLAVLPTEAIENFQSARMLGADYLASNPIRMNIPLSGQPNWLNCMVSQQPEEGLLILEFEPFETITLSAGFQHDIGIAIQKIQGRKNMNDIIQTTAEEVKKITRYDRVMIYKFEKDGHGHIVAEAKEDYLESFLGLHYPATDIPKQARALFLKEPVRVISDIQSTPAKMQPSTIAETNHPLNMSHVVARGVSPIHIEYLQNMGVQATMSIAIVFEDDLWGLIACHHYGGPKFTGFLKRNTAWMLGRIISGHLSLQMANEFRRSALEANIIKSKLFEQMAADWDVVEGLTQGDDTLLSLNSSTGAALFHENQLVVLGESPSQEDIQSLMQWLDREHGKSFLFHTDELPAAFEPAKKYQSVAAGLLAVRLSKVPGDYILWFKPERVKTVTWGGNPEKAVVKTEKGFRLSPRKSFEKWKQHVQGTSEPWLQYEIDTALALRSDVKDFIFQKYQEVKQFNRELTEAYNELESFSYSVSHDLRAPLRSIDGFANILKEDYGQKLDEDGNMLIDTILESAAKLNLFIDDILAYSRMSNREMQSAEQPLKTMAEEAVDSFLKLDVNKERKIKVKISEKLPSVHADRIMLSQLLNNLFSNALKYTRENDIAIIEVDGEEREEEVYFYIKDNGIGFDPIHKDKIFGVFNRLVHDDEYEGTGVGLAIVKRIVEKHAGKVAVDSEPNKGTIFHFHFPKK